MEKERKKLKKTVVITVIAVVLALLAGAGATFAWFSNNNKVSTNTISGKTGTGTVELLLSSNPDSFPAAGTEIALTQVNAADREKLMPVSTADLSQFVYAPSTKDGAAEYFIEDKDEERFYHAVVYVMARNGGNAEGTGMRLYLDSSSEFGGEAASDAEGNFFNACRLGLKIDGVSQTLIYFREDTKGAHENNTRIDGKIIENGSVLKGAGENTVAVKDPAVELSSLSVDSSAANVPVPANSLGVIEYNKTYRMDVYFYLEGCDEDCVNEVSYSGGNIHLALFGVIE